MPTAAAAGITACAAVSLIRPILAAGWCASWLSFLVFSLGVGACGWRESYLLVSLSEDRRWSLLYLLVSLSEGRRNGGGAGGGGAVPPARASLSPAGTGGLPSLTLEPYSSRVSRKGHGGSGGVLIVSKDPDNIREIALREYADLVRKDTAVAESALVKDVLYAVQGSHMAVPYAHIEPVFSSFFLGASDLWPRPSARPRRSCRHRGRLQAGSCAPPPSSPSEAAREGKMRTRSAGLVDRGGAAAAASVGGCSGRKEECWGSTCCRRSRTLRRVGAEGPGTAIGSQRGRRCSSFTAGVKPARGPSKSASFDRSSFICGVPPGAAVLEPDRHLPEPLIARSGSLRPIGEAGPPSAPTRLLRRGLPEGRVGQLDPPPCPPPRRPTADPICGSSWC